MPRFGRTAVERNGVKRRLREVVRTELLPRLGLFDVVVRATPGAYGASFDALREALRRAVQQLPGVTTEEAT